MKLWETTNREYDLYSMLLSLNSAAVLPRHFSENGVFVKIWSKSKKEIDNEDGFQQRDRAGLGRGHDVPSQR